MNVQPDLPDPWHGTDTELSSSSHELHSLYQAAEARAARFRLLVEMGRDLTLTRGLNALLHLALERATAFSGHDGGSVMLLRGSEGPLEVVASIGGDAIAPGTFVDNPAGSIAWHVLRSRQPLYLEGRGENIPLPRRQYTKPLPSSICLPMLAVDGHTLGVLTLKSTVKVRRLDDDDLDALQLLTSQLAAAVESVQLQEANEHLLHELAERERQLHDLVGQLLHAHDEERRRMAYELHDGLAQVATSVHQHLQIFVSRYRLSSPASQQAMKRILELSQQVVNEARQLIAGLRPTVLDDFGLATALRLQAEMLISDGWEIRYDETLGAQRLPATIETMLFRVAQEGLTNIRKHAQTRQVHMTLHRENRVIRLSIQDWGCGFDTTAPIPTGMPGTHVGLAGMRERISLLGGNFAIWSQPGQGTHITAEVPLPVCEGA